MCLVRRDSCRRQGLWIIRTPTPISLALGTGSTNLATAALLWEHEAAGSALCVGKAASAPKRLYKPWTLLLAITKDCFHLALFLRCSWSRVGSTLCQAVGEATCTKSSVFAVEEGLRALKCACFLSSCTSGSL